MTWWRTDPARLLAEYKEHGTWIAVKRAHPEAPDQKHLADWYRRHGLPPLQVGMKAKPVTTAAEPEDGWLLEAIRKAGDKATVEELADQADVSPRRVREALDRLGADGYRLEADEAVVQLHRVPPAKDNLHPALFDGEQVRVGVVSDTHLGAKEEALPELHLAYDVFEAEGITQVWHAGDWGTGVDIFKGHHSEANVHTLDEQVAYLVEHYPRRDGIVTRGIAGNHDLQGAAGKAGFDPLVPVAAQRDDIEYLGAYEAWLETRPDTGRWIHLLHGAGGMSYSWSYKAQKMVDSYPSGRKPSALIVGHWHVRGNVRARDVEVLWPGCFEWQSRFMARLGLQPAVGFHILEMVVGEDGSIVRWRPEWFPYYAGRELAA